VQVTDALGCAAPNTVTALKLGATHNCTELGSPTANPTMPKSFSNSYVFSIC
jgi:hypothetical protein